MATKFFLNSFFAYFFMKQHLHDFSQIKSHKEVTQQYESRGFLLFLLGDRRLERKRDEKITK
jgi:hypothetical protein